MKTPPLLCLLLAFGLAAPAARAQFPNYPAADKVLGSTTFIGAGSGSATPSGIHSPAGIAIDPTTGKLFVASVIHNRILRFANATSLANGANAEAVFGQLNFSGSSSGTTATTLNSPYGLHVDSSGRLWVADFGNNRVLMFQGASVLPGFRSVPDLVLGQPDFTTVTSGNSATKMDAPISVYVDVADRLWVADYSNHRVLLFPNASSLANGAAATTVLGQPDFTTDSPGASSVKMNFPSAVLADDQGRVWVTEQVNNRVLRFDNAATLSNGAPANGVLGQPDFTSSLASRSDQRLQEPGALAMDGAGTLYLSDYFNGRVLFFKNPAAKANGAAADGVIGQPDFTTNSPGATERRLGGPFGGLAFDATGALWVSDYAYHRVLRFSPDRSAAAPIVQGKVPKTTSKSSLALKGTASDSSGVASVRYRVNGGAFRNAGGTTSWQFTAKLRNGTNTIDIVTIDTFGNTSPTKRLKVTRK